MAKSDKKPTMPTDIEALLSRTNTLLNKKKMQAKRKAAKKYCTKCKSPLIYSAGMCKDCFLEGRKQREELRVGKSWVSTDGYWRVYDAEGKIKLLHRHVVEQSLGITLRRSQIVRHKDGDKNNNELDNLVIEGLDLSQIVCPHCKEPLTRPLQQPELPQENHLPK
jgi:hypothetical protein